jgi:hypothetical protein
MALTELDVRHIDMRRIVTDPSVTSLGQPGGTLPLLFRIGDRERTVTLEQVGGLLLDALALASARIHLEHPTHYGAKASPAQVQEQIVRSLADEFARFAAEVIAG